MNKVVICGGGSTYTLPLMKTLCEFSTEDFPIKEILLFDIDESKQDMIYRASKVIAREVAPHIVINQTYDISTAFENADFVLMQIRAGGLEMREQDEKVPLRHDCVGQETCGAGGFAYGMRSVPQVVEIMKEARKQAPNAWIINYSNPAAIVAEATKRYFPGDKKIINLCDMPIAILDGFAECMGKKRADLSPRYFGLNHFGWFTNLYDQDGNDLLPIIRERIKAGNVLPDELKNDSGWVETFQSLADMVNDFDGYVPNTYLKYYLYPEKVVAHSDKEYTRANYVMDNRLELVRRGCEYIIGNNTMQGTGLEKGVHGMYIVELCRSILNNEGKLFIAMIENKGIITNLPEKAMVEVPCFVTSNGLEPLHVGEIPTFYKGLLEAQYAYECLAVDALINKDKDAALKALVLNRTVVDTSKAKLLLDDLIEANKDYWSF